MKRIRRLCGDEKGAASIVEYSIVLPLCLLVVVFIFLMGLYLEQKAIVESACERGLAVAMKMYNDPTSDSIYNFDYGKEAGQAGFGGSTYDFNKMKSDPYRYWGDYRSGSIKTRVESFVSDSITKAQLTVNAKWCGTPSVKYESNGGLLGKKAHISVKQEYTILPIVSANILPNTKASIETDSYLNIINQTEFIRNTDFVCDLLRQFEAVQKVISAITSAIDKITDFFKG